jgi:hypothetical protein
MVDPRAKGAKAETVIRDALRTYTGLDWERVPMSGALDPKHGLKGDLYVPDQKNLYCVECKHYADDHFNSSLFTGKNPQLIQWWEQTVRQGKQVNRKPLLIFKHDRSKLLAMYEDYPDNDYRYANLLILGQNMFVSLLEDWITNEKPKFIE